MLQREEDILLFSKEQGQLLVQLARRTILARLGVEPDQRESLNQETVLQADCFKEKRGTFVCLKSDGHLRGCVGHLTSDLPVIEGVRANALAAAFRDPRFAPLALDELSLIRLEVSVLTAPLPLVYHDAAELVARLRPGVDGVILGRGVASATFLPQVWEQLPRPEDFLSRLCLKAGLAADQWQHSPLETKTYQVQYFAEDR